MGPIGLPEFFILFVFSVPTAATAYLLAKEKGRNVALWTIVGLIPILNFCSIWFFVGAANHRLERRIDQLLESRGDGVRPPLAERIQ